MKVAPTKDGHHFTKARLVCPQAILPIPKHINKLPQCNLRLYQGSLRLGL